MRDYLVITFGYWGFTITDGAIRMLVVLYFHQIGYSPLQIAMLFLFYEFFGIVTNLTGGWLGARIGLNKTMHIGMALQIFALAMLTVPDSWLSVAYVMLAQALSGIAKDLNKMSAKASVKLMLPKQSAVTGQAESQLFRWVAVLTGSKNSLKGAGFFIGAALLSFIGFRGALLTLASALGLVLVFTMLLLPSEIGKTSYKPKFKHIFSKTPQINWLSAARFFLFGARDVWFVVALPVFLGAVLGWKNTEVGSFLALWIIGYGLVQAITPRVLSFSSAKKGPQASTSRNWIFVLALVPAGIALALQQFDYPALSIIIGLSVFGIIFAINSAIHSYLVLAYSDHDKVSFNVGFYYMANAGGRLTGTVFSGLTYQYWGLIGCLWISALFLVIAAMLSVVLSAVEKQPHSPPVNL